MTNFRIRALIITLLIVANVLLLYQSQNYSKYSYVNAISSQHEAVALFRKYLDEVEGIPSDELYFYDFSGILKESNTSEYWTISFHLNMQLHKEAFIIGEVYAKDGSIHNIRRLNDDELHMTLNE